MFPYTSAGPIVRYTDIETQLKQRTINIFKFGIGAELFVKGLAKKVLLADNLSVLYSSISGHPQMSVFTSWLGILAIQCSFILTSAAIRIWPSVWENAGI